MSHTDGMWSQDSPSNDLEIFVGATEFKPTQGNGTLNSSGSGDIHWQTTAPLTESYVANITACLKRIIYATPSLVQEQFGTAASLPGPTAVSGTSDPEALRGYPPYPASQLATLHGTVTGPYQKGVRVNSLDAIYNCPNANLNYARATLNVINYIDNAPITNQILLDGTTTNNLPATQRANIYRANVAVTTPMFITTSGAELMLHLQLGMGGGTGFLSFWGCVLKCSLNLN